MSSGAITVTPGWTFDEVLGEVVTLPKLNLLGRPTLRVDEGAITRRELQTAITEQMDTATANVEDLLEIVVTGGSALVTRTTTLEAQMANTASSGLQSRIATEETVRASADTTLASRTTTLESQVQTPTTGLLARVTTIETTYATDSEVSAAISSAIAAEVTNRDAAISASASALTTAYVAADSALNTALGGRITTLESQVQTPTTGLLARVTTIETTYATDSEVSAAIASEVSARNSAISAAVATETSARIAADGSIHARWGVAIDVNGRIIGRINLDGTNQTSEFGILANKFSVTDATTLTTPFQIVGTKARFTSDVEINGGLLINGTVTAAALSVANLAAINADMGAITAGTITLNTSGYIRGGQSGWNSGTGFWLGYDGAAYKLSIGNSGAGRLTWDGTDLKLTRANQVEASDGTTRALLTATTIALEPVLSGYPHFNTSQTFLELANSSTKFFQVDVATNNEVRTRGLGFYMGNSDAIAMTEGAGIVCKQSISSVGSSGATVLIETPGNYGVIELGGPDGGIIDLKRPYSDDYDLRIISDSGGGGRLETTSNGDIFFSPDGTGRVKFGSYTATPGTITGYIEIKDAGGTTRKLAVTT